jgi:hypothetical protein
MKKMFFCIFTALFFSSVNYGQEFKPMKSPDVTAFVNANYLPIDESTGKTNIIIPIYTIDFDGMSFPISISYNTGGVKVNAAASKIGLNWTLNGLGVINKEIQGQEDLSSRSHLISGTNQRLYTQYGYLRHLLTFSPTSPSVISHFFRDTKPDFFYAMGSNINTKFVHKSNGETFDLLNTGVKIESPFMNSALHNLYWRFRLKPGFKFKVIPTNGLEYSFEDYGFHNFETSEFFQNSSLLPVTTTLEDYVGLFFSGPLMLARASKRDLFPTMHISSITNPITKNKIYLPLKEKKIC